MNNLTSAEPKSARFETLAWWTVTLLWAGLIFGASTGAFSASLTAQILMHLFQFLHIHVSPPVFESIHFLVRKCAHMTEYAVFALLLYRAWRPEHRFRWSRRTALYVAVAVALYSLTDEFHQSFVPDRTSSLVDCGIDTSGALLGLLFIYVINKMSYITNSNKEEIAVVAGEK